MSGPGVYAFMQGKHYLYVGCTSDLSKRPNKRDRGHVSRWQAIVQATRTELMPCESIAKAQQLEERLIRTHHPTYNLRKPRAAADMERTASIIHSNW